MIPGKTPNEVRIEGRVAFDPRTNQAGSGKVTNFAISVPTGRGEASSTIRCVAWHSDCQPPTFAKGDFLRVAGRIASRVYDKKQEGGGTVKVEVTEVVCDEVERVAHKGASTAPAPLPPGRPGWQNKTDPTDRW